MLEKLEGVKNRIGLNGGKALLEFENGDIGIEDSDGGTLIMFRGTEVQDFTEKYVGFMTEKVLKEMSKNGNL